MTNLQIIHRAKLAIRFSPLFFCGAMAMSLATYYCYPVPFPFLLACIGLGIVLATIIALLWRERSKLLRFVFIFLIFSQFVLWHYFGDNQDIGVPQGCFITCTVTFGLMMLLRRWIYKFAKLEETITSVPSR